MNYHKKLQTLGFKKTDPLVVCNYDIYLEMIDGLKIVPLSEFIKEKEPIKKDYRIKIDEFNMADNKDQLHKLQTYCWKITDEFTIYISIFKENYCCFGYDSGIEEHSSSFWNKSMVNEKVFIINKGTLNSQFWKIHLIATMLDYSLHYDIL